MPGNADGSLAGIALKPLTVAFHEPGFIATLQAENQQPFWFMMSAAQRQQAGNPLGPANPQALNRYSYVLNSPLKWTDPSGHSSRKVGNDDASYDDVCSKGGVFVDCDTPESSTVINEEGDTLKQVCVQGQCEYVWSGTGLFQDFARAVDGMMANYTAAGLGMLGTGLALPIAAVACLSTAGTGCIPAAIGYGISAITSLYYLGLAGEDLLTAQTIFADIRRYNRNFPPRPRP